MGAVIKKVVRFLTGTWKESPWIKSVGVIGSLTVGLAFLNLVLPDGIAIDLKNFNEQLILPGLLILYFFTVSIYSGNRLDFEKKLRTLEQNFRYDNRGTL